MKQQEILIVADFMSIWFSHYHAHMQTPLMFNGLNTSPLNGVLNTVLSTMHNYKTNRVVLCDDIRGNKRFRRKIYKDYKRKDAQLAEDFQPAMDHSRWAVSELCKLPLIGCQDYEADDVIAAYCRAANEKGIFVIVVSKDKDLRVLANGGTHLLMQTATADDRKRYGSMRVWTQHTVCEKYGFHPKRISDFLALAGDAADNIPGVPGIGSNKAAQLVAMFGDVETIIAMQDHLPLGKKQAEKFAESIDDLRKYKQLTSLYPEIIDQLPDVDTCIWEPTMQERVQYADGLVSSYGLNVAAQKVRGSMPKRTDWQKQGNTIPDCIHPDLELQTDGFIF